MRDRARFTEAAPGDGLYESFYLKAARAGRAVWLRHTAFKRPGEAVVGSLWAVLFDAGWERPVAWKQSFDDIAARDYVHIGPARLAPGVASGPSWQLEFSGDAPSF